MPFKKGDPKPQNAGRKAGTPNKATQDLFAICEKHGVNVFESMVILAVQAEEPKEKFQRLETIAKYLYPQRKAVEVSADENSGFKIIVEDYRTK